MTRSVVVMPEAEKSLRENAAWWAEHRSFEQSERWYDEFVVALEGLNAPALTRLFSRLKWLREKM